MLTKIKSNLLNNKETVNRLRPDEENQLVMKLNEPLRQDLIGHNKLAVLKSSIFFLCRWSKHFQKNIAQVITSALYMPGEQIFQPLNK
jgi:serine protease inhibitor